LINLDLLGYFLGQCQKVTKLQGQRKIKSKSLKTKPISLGYYIYNFYHKVHKVLSQSSQSTYSLKCTPKVGQKKGELLIDE